MASLKVVSSFLPAAAYGAKESDRHYLRVHLPLARRLLGEVTAMSQYTTYRATDQLDACGTFERRPAVWRYVALRFGENAGTADFPAAVAERLSDDHAFCLSHLRRCDVAEEVLHDTLSGQTSLSSYFVDLERRPEASADEALELATELAAKLAERAAALPGIRRVIANRVVRETATEPMDEPGQLLTDRFVEDSTKVMFVEVVADARAFGDDLFADAAVDSAITDCKRTGEVACVAVEELCGFDRR